MTAVRPRRAVPVWPADPIDARAPGQYVGWSGSSPSTRSLAVAVVVRSAAARHGTRSARACQRTACHARATGPPLSARRALTSSDWPRSWGSSRGEGTATSRLQGGLENGEDPHDPREHDRQDRRQRQRQPAGKAGRRLAAFQRRRVGWPDADRLRDFGAAARWPERDVFPRGDIRSTASVGASRCCGRLPI